MSERPDVSVVMSAHNDARYLADCIESVLGQEGVDLEFIAIDDGSTDGSGDILDRHASADERMRVLHQPNRGLTRALISGCSIARGRYIARQDSDDISFPGRLFKLAACLDTNPDLVLASSLTAVMGPNGELLLSRTAAEGYRGSEDDTFCHGSLMFKRSAYERAGGYRREFVAAQDVDLQFRLAELGKMELIPEELYAYRIREGSISARSPLQRRLSEIAVAARDARRSGRDEQLLLEKAARVSGEPSEGPRIEPGTGNYFIGRCLYARRDRRAATYLWAACKSHPLSVRNWAALAQAALLVRSEQGLNVTLSGVSMRREGKPGWSAVPNS